MARKSKKDKWFIKVRGSYLPNNWSGWLIYFPFVGYLVFAAIFEWQNANSHLQAILFTACNWLAATVIMTWIAQRTG